MRTLEGVLVPGLVTLLLHGAVLWLISENWTPDPQPRINMTPRHVSATLVKLDAAAPKKAEPKPAPKPAPKPEPKSEPKPKPEPDKQHREAEKKRQQDAEKKAQQAASQKKKQAEAEKKRQADEAKRQREREAAEKKRKEEAAAREREQQRQREIALAKQAEADAARTAEEGQKAMSYAAAIAETIADYWSRPPSARREMSVTLLIQLIPTGEVIGVSVVESSGDEAFDRSAINAVNKAERFPEVADAPPRVFEQYLRQLRLVFRPEDLRL